MKPCNISTRAKNKDGYAVLNYELYGYATEHRYIMARYLKRKLRREEVVRHLCNNPGCIEITHLALGTQKDNIQDSVDVGTHKNPILPRIKNPRAKLTEIDIENILALHNLGMDYKEIAKEMKVSRATIDKILKGQTWKEV